MRRMISIFAALLIAAGVAGCASSGVRVSDQQAAALGTPTTVTSRPDGSKVAVYTYTHAHANAAAFIPFVGMFVGGTDVHSRSVAFGFDPRGVLKDHATTVGNAQEMLGEPTSAAPGTNTQQ